MTAVLENNHTYSQKKYRNKKNVQYHLSNFRGRLGTTMYIYTYFKVGTLAVGSSLRKAFLPPLTAQTANAACDVDKLGH